MKDTLPRVLLKDERLTNASCAGPAFLHTFRLVHMLVDTADAYDKLDAQWSGTTATTVLHSHKTGHLLFAHVGDSSAVVGRTLGKPEAESSCCATMRYSVLEVLSSLTCDSDVMRSPRPQRQGGPGVSAHTRPQANTVR